MTNQPTENRVAKQLILIKIGELSLKGGNRQIFEKKLIKNIKRKLKNLQFSLHWAHRRLHIECGGEDADAVCDALSETFGIVGYAKTFAVDKEYKRLEEAAGTICAEYLAARGEATFKIAARRTDKSFPLSSYDIAVKVGDFARKAFPGLTVDVKNPDLTVSVEVRERIYVYGNPFPGPGGLPVGCAGRGLLLLSGGIDSPIAGYLMAKRGLRLDAVYFHTYPFTSDQAKEKVRSIVERLSGYLCGANLIVVPFTEIASRIRSGAPEEQITLLMRACMMDLGARIASLRGALCLVTGESLSQVASQTPESIRFTESTSDLPVFRPLIGMDKEEIISVGRSIGTYELSILPYPDCCVVFAPKRPLIKPKYSLMRNSLERLELEEPLRKAVEEIEISWIMP